MSVKKETAMALFNQGYSCSQAVLGAFCEELNLDKETALKLASSFGGGMARLREVCGTVSGLFMAAGLKYGFSDPKDASAKTEHYQRMQELAAAFRAENGSIVCRELLGLPAGPDAPQPAPRTPQYYKKRPCAELVGCAAEILEKYMREHPSSKNETDR